MKAEMERLNLFVKTLAEKNFGEFQEDHSIVEKQPRNTLLSSIECDVKFDSLDNIIKDLLVEYTYVKEIS
jgi:hypothetical protein